MKSINNKQKQLIAMARKQTGMCEPCYRKLVLETCEGNFTGSTKDLTYDEASGLINRFVEMGFTIKPRIRRSGAHRPPAGTRMSGTAMRTRDQVDKMNVLIGLIKWRVKDGYKGFIRRMIGRTEPVTIGEASKVIEAMKGMLLGQWQRCEVADTPEVRRAIEDLSRFNPSARGRSDSRVV